MALKKRYFMVRESVVYKGAVHAKDSMIIEFDRDDDIKFQNFLNLVSDNPFDPKAMVVEVQGSDIPKVIKGSGIKKVFVETGSSPEVYAEIEKIMSVANPPVTEPVEEQDSEISEDDPEPLADEPTEAAVVPEDEPVDEPDEDEEVILPIKRKKHR